jgi:hypothetical protein
MSISRTKALVFGLLAMVLVGAVAGASASASPGPFWYHRALGSEGAGVKVSPNHPEGFKGEGGEQRYVSTVGTEPVEIALSRVQVKGAISNNAFQGQTKLELIYNQPHVVKPAALAGTCVVKIGENNIVQLKGHLMWKFKKGGTELTEQGAAGQSPEGVATPKEIQQGATKLPEGVFVTIHYAATGCGIFPATANIEGSQLGFGFPSELGVFSQTLAVRTTGGREELVHFWNGEKNVEGKVGLKSNGTEVAQIGQTEAKANQQEIAVKES